jgi:hypothetical protein
VAAGHDLTSRTFGDRADDAHRAALLVRDLLERAGRDTPVVPEDGVA